MVVHYTHVQISRTHAVNYDDDDGPRGLCTRVHGTYIAIVHRSPPISNYTNAISKTIHVFYGLAIGYES